MASKLYEIAFQIGGKLQGSLGKSVTTAAGQLEGLGRKISQLEKAQGTSNRFRSLHREIDDTKLKLHQAEAEMNHLGQAVGPMTASMARQFEAAQAKVAALRGQFRAEVTELKSVRSAMDAAGIGTRTFAADNAKLAATLAKTKASQISARENLGARAANKTQSQEARSKLSASMGNVFAATAPLAAFAMPLKWAADVEDAMVRTAALAHADDEQLARLTATARKLGQETRFSTVQAAEGMQALAKNSFKTNEIIAAMPGVLQIAAAGAVDVGDAAEITSTILHEFNMRAEETGHMGDVLINTSTNASATLADLGEAMKYVGPIAKATGVSLEQTAAAIGLLAKSGIRGGEAGTALRQMLSRLSAPRAAGQKDLASLGLGKKDLQDAKGNLLPLDQILTTLSKKMAKFGTATKAGMATHIFGMEAATAATVLLEQAGSGNLQKFTTLVSKSGTAEEIAAKQNATFKGWMDNLFGSVQDLGIELGYKMIPTLKDLTKSMLDVLNPLTKWLGEHPKLTTALVLGSAALLTLILGLTVAGVAFSGIRLVVLAAKGAMLLMNAATWKAVAAWTAANLPLLLYVAGIAGLIWIAAQLYAAWTPVSQWFAELWDDALDGIGKYLDSIKTLAKVATFIPGMASLSGAVDLIPDIGTSHRADRNRRFNEEAFNRIAPYSSLGGPMREGQPWSMLDGAKKLAGDSGGKGDVTYSPTFSPQINLAPGTATRGDVEKAMAAAQREFEKMMKGFMAQERRTALE